jgi:hypothetical protein
MNSIPTVSFPITGAIDLHVHCSPDVRPRKSTAWELVRMAQASAMGALLLKNHDVPTVAQAEILRQATKFSVYGGVVLNEAVGGLNPHAVDTALRMGGKMVWMPTHCSQQERSYRGKKEPGLKVLDERELLTADVKEILALISSADAMLATGHLSEKEIYILVRGARQAGVRKILINHPEIKIQRLSEALQREIAGPDVYYERCYPRALFTHDWDALAKVTRDLGWESTILATDLGQPDSMDAVAGLAQMQGEFLARGFSQAQVRVMTCETPARLLGLQ